MAELRMGDPWDAATDMGPVIDEKSRDGVASYVAAMRARGLEIFSAGALPGRACSCNPM